LVAQWVSPSDGFSSGTSAQYIEKLTLTGGVFAGNTAVPVLGSPKVDNPAGIQILTHCKNIVKKGVIMA
jgi:hypothetical protein